MIIIFFVFWEIIILIYEFYFNIKFKEEVLDIVNWLWNVEFEFVKNYEIVINCYYISYLRKILILVRLL